MGILYIHGMPAAKKNNPGCPTEATLAVIGGRWKVPILWNLQASRQRFGELSRLLPGITQKMLTQQLRELESDGLVLRTVYAEVPPRVEYSLTDLGTSLQPVLATLTSWGEVYLKRHAAKKTPPIDKRPSPRHS